MMPLSLRALPLMLFTPRYPYTIYADDAPPLAAAACFRHAAMAALRHLRSLMPPAPADADAATLLPELTLITPHTLC